MIEIRDVTKLYQAGEVTVKALDSVNFDMKTDEMTVILGRSGSGKTTFLSLIGALTKPTSGSVSINGIDLWTLKDKDQSIFRNKNIGFIFQFPSLIPTLNILDNLRLPTIFDEKGRVDENRTRAKELLASVDLGDRLDSYASQLSGGEQRRVAIARSLINEPQIILADEPTGDLDEETEAQIIEILAKVNKEGTGILMVTHNTELASIAGRTVRMTSGTLKEIK